ncbi:hypothetical protein Taro_042726 [Colocasia esculenta]|uniref:Plant heme peroxidase family profile domain-containing protein n=1 Tax=Colocasia esculenta TaxID=4460 RepID=A0A843X334_COLES|nr:hypothetical protein [Colocasia esculenta]
MVTTAAPVTSTFKFPHPNGTTRPPPAPPRPSRQLPALCSRCRLPTTTTVLPAVQVEAPCSPSSSSSSSISSSVLGSNGGTEGISASRFRGRRGLVLLSAVSFFLSRHHGAELFDANARGIGVDESLVVRTEVRKVLSKAKAAGVVRLAFHDAGTFSMDDNRGGMNGSIVLELDRPENLGLKKPVLEKAKNELDKVRQVSWADLIAVAGAEAVSLCGGPNIPVRLGRMDARMPDPEGRLPEEKLNASELKKCFLGKGLSMFMFLMRPYCSCSDNMKKMIGLPSDHALVDDEECLRWITTYAADQMKFFDDFSRAYVKLVNTGASWGKA